MTPVQHAPALLRDVCSPPSMHLWQQLWDLQLAVHTGARCTLPWLASRPQAVSRRAAG